ncbi:hypothetical protein L914_07684 [Phytophthora nicotianae]|uniref:Uncharacterized protein n=1 Tax=Phytophthora nicotianae TaxID=4792 RepID=W2NJ47_PHYNI|nr:hypothetical protein L914_07684 [Phytophthora nicotianae]
MFLCAVTRPRGDWDSKIGLWPIVETYVTQRASCNRAAGVEELRSVAISREAFEAMTTDTPNKTFLTLQMVMTQIMNHGGRNDFRLGHMHKDKLTNAGTLPISLPCDSQTLVSAHFDMDRLSALDTPSPPAQPLLVPPLHDEMPPPSPSELDPFLFL